jgi:hypothetical protein
MRVHGLLKQQQEAAWVLWQELLLLQVHIDELSQQS